MTFETFELVNILFGVEILYFIKSYFTDYLYLSF
jgi:hypothetical protein